MQRTFRKIIAWRRRIKVVRRMRKQVEFSRIPQEKNLLEYNSLSQEKEGENTVAHRKRENAGV